MPNPKLPTTHPLNLAGELWSITQPGYIQASARHIAGSEHFEGMFFARDAIQVALDIGEYYPELLAKTIFQIANLQGTEYNPVSEEEPGRIHHQLIGARLGAAAASPGTLKTMHSLALEWGYVKSAREAKKLNELIYYGAVDTTPQFVRLVAKYCRLVGSKNILQAKFNHYKAGRRSLRESVVEAAQWLERRRSNAGFITFKATNPLGILNQYLRDSDVSTLHEGCKPLSYDYDGVSGLDVQCAYYDCLGDLAFLLGGKLAKQFTQIQKELQETFVEHFWLGDKLAMALDHDPNGNLRPVKTASNIQAEVFDCGILNGLKERQEITTAVLAQMFGADFWTSVGLRSLALNSASPNYGYPAYQSQHTVWNVMSGIASRGLDKSGFHALARKLDAQILAAADKAGGSFEAYYVDDSGFVAFDVTDSPEFDRTKIISTNVFCAGQAFTISTLLRARWSRQNFSPKLSANEDWKEVISTKLLGNLPEPKISVFKAWVDQPAGQAAERKLRYKLGLINKT